MISLHLYNSQAKCFSKANCGVIVQLENALQELEGTQVIHEVGYNNIVAYTACTVGFINET
jgi:hypothetical protein